MSKAFSTLPLKAQILKTLEQLNYTFMTEIQEKALPLVLEGADIIAKAKTGSGKTAAFGIGIIEQLDLSLSQHQALIIVPTRELALQVTQSLRDLARDQSDTKIVTLYGGVPLATQGASLQKGAHIIVGTPGRIEDHLGKQTLNLKTIRTVVLDEADRMLDMGFLKSVEKIISHTSTLRQTLLFSATFPKDIVGLSARIQKEPKEIFINDDAEKEATIKEYFFAIQGEKNPFLRQLLDAMGMQSTIIFCNTKEACHAVADDLSQAGKTVKELHGDMDQKERHDTWMMFSNKTIPILVATDIAARGLDIDDVTAVINMDFPFKPEIYVHRIGRTGRMQKAGTAYSLIGKKEERSFKALQEYQDRTIELQAFDLSCVPSAASIPNMHTIMIFGGKKKKLRKGDIIGALCQSCGLDVQSIGKIDILDDLTYLAVSAKESGKVLNFFKEGTIKKRRFKAKRLV